jgi:hypothetical protein
MGPRNCSDSLSRNFLSTSICVAGDDQTFPGLITYQDDYRAAVIVSQDNDKGTVTLKLPKGEGTVDLPILDQAAAQSQVTSDGGTVYSFGKFRYEKIPYGNGPKDYLIHILSGPSAGVFAYRDGRVATLNGSAADFPPNRVSLLNPDGGMPINLETRDTSAVPVTTKLQHQVVFVTPEGIAQTQGLPGVQIADCSALGSLSNYKYSPLSADLIWDPSTHADIRRGIWGDNASDKPDLVLTCVDETNAGSVFLNTTDVYQSTFKKALEKDDKKLCGSLDSDHCAALREGLRDATNEHEKESWLKKFLSSPQGGFLAGILLFTLGSVGGHILSQRWSGSVRRRVADLEAEDKARQRFEEKKAAEEKKKAEKKDKPDKKDDDDKPSGGGTGGKGVDSSKKVSVSDDLADLKANLDLSDPNAPASGAAGATAGSQKFSMEDVRAALQPAASFIPYQYATQIDGQWYSIDPRMVNDTTDLGRFLKQLSQGPSSLRGSWATSFSEETGYMIHDPAVDPILASAKPDEVAAAGYDMDSIQAVGYLNERTDDYASEGVSKTSFASAIGHGGGIDAPSFTPSFAPSFSVEFAPATAPVPVLEPLPI